MTVRREPITGEIKSGLGTDGIGSAASEEMPPHLGQVALK